MQALKIEIFGKVQGVFFRVHTANKAKELKIKGTVKNQPDGSVQILAEGEAENLSLLKEWCNRGPILAKVDRVEIEETLVLGYIDFTIL